MRSRFLLFLWMTSLVFGSDGYTMQSPVPSPTVDPSSIPSFGPSPGLSPEPASSPSPVASAAPLGLRRSSRLLEEFRRAQVNAVRAERHAQKVEISELKASQRARFKEWREKEKRERREFFKTTTDGKAKRVWMQEHHQRREALLKMHRQEHKTREREHRVKLQSMRTEHADKLKEFRQSLNSGQVPSDSLWPNGRAVVKSQ